MHEAVLKYISFDERVFHKGPVLLDDGIYTHMLTPDLDDYLPVIEGLPEGEYALFISATEKNESVCLEFCLYSSGHKKVRRKSVSLEGFRLHMPLFATGSERDEYRTTAYEMVLAQALESWFSETNGYLFETLSIYTRAVIEGTFGDIMTLTCGPTDTASYHCSTCTVH